MSVFGGLVLTNQGKALLTKVQTGVKLNYTKVSIGDGSLGSSSKSDLAALINKVKDLSITKLKVLPTGKSVVGTVLSNQNISTGFYFRELGVFAQDPDIGEILYCYGNAGANAEYIPASGGSDVIEKSIDINFLVGNASNVSAVIDQSLVYASPSDVAEVLSEAKAYTDGKVYSISNVEVTNTSAVDVITYTPNTPGNFEIDMYLRITGKTNVTVAVTYADDTGPQTKIMTYRPGGLYFQCSSGIQSYADGSYSLTPLFINSVAGTPIIVKVTASVANQVYVSSSIMEV